MGGYLIRQRKHLDSARAKEVANLGLGAILHDVGISKLPADVVDRYRRTGDESDADWQEHPSLGYEMVHGKVKPTAATVVLHHHQRCDGSGYAGSRWPVLSEHRIHVFARIAGLADQFDRMCHPVDGSRRPAVSVIRELLNERYTRMFEPQVVRGLFLVVPAYPPGSVVRLSDGRWAVVIDHAVSDPCHPVVQTLPGSPETFSTDDLEVGPCLDLNSETEGVDITEHDGVDVRTMNFPPPRLLESAHAELAYM